MTTASTAAVVAQVPPQQLQPQPQPQLQPQQQPLPEPEQVPASELDADPNVQSAIRFLQDPRVRSSPVESQIRFLKGKNMSDAQIRHAFAKVGKTVTAEKMMSVRAPAPVTSTTSTMSSSSARAPSSQFNSRPLSTVTAPLPQPQYSQTLFPRTPPPPQEELQTKGVDWRDVVIGAGAAIIASVAGYKLFNRYSPYEIRRKSDKKPSRAFRGGPYAPHQRPALSGSSESEMDVSAFPPPQLRAPPLLPPPPTAPATAEGAAGVAATTAASAADAEELKRLQTQLDETREALTNERKKCADLAVSSAKIRAEKQQLSRANDRLTQQIDALKKDVEKLEEEKATAFGTGKLTATEEEPPKAFCPLPTVEAEEARNSPTTLSPMNAAPMAAPVTAAAAATAAAVIATSPAAELALAPSTSSPAPEPAVEVVPAVAAASAPAQTPPPVPAPAPPAAETAVPSSLTSVVPPAFLTPEPIKQEKAPAAPII